MAVASVMAAEGDDISVGVGVLIIVGDGVTIVRLGLLSWYFVSCLESGESWQPAKNTADRVIMSSCFIS